MIDFKELNENIGVTLDDQGFVVIEQRSGPAPMPRVMVGADDLPLLIFALKQLVEPARKMTREAERDHAMQYEQHLRAMQDRDAAALADDLMPF